MSDPKPTRLCRRCHEVQPLEKFVIQKGYRIWQCNSCRALAAQVSKEAIRNRRISRLLAWPVK